LGIPCGHLLAGVGRVPIWPAAQQALLRARPSTVADVHNHAQTQPGQRLSRVSRAVAWVRLSAAKDRTFKTVRPNQGTASGTVPIRRQTAAVVNHQDRPG
jgi:hypothetical protein